MAGESQPALLPTMGLPWSDRAGPGFGRSKLVSSDARRRYEKGLEKLTSESRRFAMTLEVIS